jgi:phage/plasmid primase-like uncharacterized protein
MIEFRQAQQADGLVPPEHIEPGRFYRFPGAGKGKSNRAGWCTMFADGQGGAYGDYSTGLSGTWQAKRERPLSNQEKEAFRKQIEESKRQAEEQRLQDQRKAAVRANSVLESATGDPATHPYIIKKKLPPHDRIKRGPWPQRGWPDALLIPMIDEHGKTTSVQAIGPDGAKDFLRGGKKKGCFRPLGKFRGATGLVLIGEGLATVAAAVEATGYLGVVAFDAGNLIHVVEMVRRLAPDAEIVILADDDQKPGDPFNPGIEAATKAARAVGGKVALPSMDKKADFWDLWNEQGVDAVRQAIEAAAPVEDQRVPQSGSSAPGGGNDDTGYYPPETIQALNDLNKTYAGVVMGGDFRVAKEGFDEHHKKHTLSFLKITALYNLLANMKARVSVGPDKGYELRPLAKLWMEWDGRRTYEDIVFDPSCKCGFKVYNLFRGFPIEPKAGDWSLMKRHIKEIICDGNEEYYTYLMSWMARIVQDPGGARPGVAVVLKGGKGIGKGVFAEYYGSIFGEAFLPISDAESFTGRFNMHLSKSLFVFLDEAVWGGDKKAEGKMKQLITERRVLFEPKGIDTMALDNHINVLIASNEDWVIPATGDERRFFVLNPNEKYKCDIAYFSAIGREKDNGGIAAMMHDLLAWDYRVCELRKAPKTEGLSEQVQESLPSVLDFWFTVLGRGYMLSAFETGAPARTKLSIGDELWPVEVLKYEVFQEYIQWCKRQNERYIKTEQQFWSATWKFWPGKKKRVRKRDTQTSSGFVEVLQLPHLSKIRDAFTAETRIEFCTEELDLRPFDNQF